MISVLVLLSFFTVLGLVRFVLRDNHKITINHYTAHCPNCKGQGKVWAARGFICIAVKCEPCDGTGYKYRIVPTTPTEEEEDPKDAEINRLRGENARLRADLHKTLSEDAYR